MKEKAYFVWEINFAGQWAPVVYFGEKPSKRMEYNIERSPVYEVPDDCIVNGEPVFGKLKAKFPAPESKDLE